MYIRCFMDTSLTTVFFFLVVYRNLYKIGLKTVFQLLLIETLLVFNLSTVIFSEREIFIMHNSPHHIGMQVLFL